MLSIVIYCSMNGLRGIAAKCVMLVLPYYVNVGYAKETKNSFLLSFITYFSRIFVFLRVSSKVATASWLGNDALNIEDRILCKIFLFLSLWRVSLWPRFSTITRGGGICDLSSLGGLSDDLFTWDLKKKCKIKNGSRRKPGKRFSNHCQVMLMYFPSAGLGSGAHDIKGQGTRGNELLATLLHVPVATANHTIAWPAARRQMHAASRGLHGTRDICFVFVWNIVRLRVWRWPTRSSVVVIDVPVAILTCRRITPSAAPTSSTTFHLVLWTLKTTSLIFESCVHRTASCFIYCFVGGWSLVFHIVAVLCYFGFCFSCSSLFLPSFASWMFWNVALPCTYLFTKACWQPVGWRNVRKNLTGIKKKHYQVFCFIFLFCWSTEWNFSFQNVQCVLVWR